MRLLINVRKQRKSHQLPVPEEPQQQREIDDSRWGKQVQEGNKEGICPSFSSLVLHLHYPSLKEFNGEQQR